MSRVEAVIVFFTRFYGVIVAIRSSGILFFLGLQNGKRGPETLKLIGLNDSIRTLGPNSHSLCRQGFIVIEKKRGFFVSIKALNRLKTNK